MKRSMSFLIAFLLFSAPCLFCGDEEGVISLEALLREMIDRNQLARLPDPAYTCRQFSSYDRKAKAPGEEGWFSNYDNREYLREEKRAGRVEKVLMDAEGPGAIGRFWVTAEGPGHGNGILRFYFDGNEEPAIEGEVFDIISGQVLARTPLSKSVPPTAEPTHRGHNLYLPIPYARSMKVTFEPAEDRPFFYQINYRTYEKGTAIKTFSIEELKAARPLLREIEYTLSKGGRDPLMERAVKDFSCRLEPKQAITVFIPGPACINKVVLNLEAEDMEQALRSTVLEMTFDGEPTVWCPAGDFFGMGHQLHPFRTWYVEAAPNGTMACYWIMPFAAQAVVTVQNLGVQPVSLDMARLGTGMWKWDDRSMHFHCAWHELYKRQTIPGGDEDVNYVTVHGRGVFVGDSLVVFNGTEEWGWWGEGDEKIYVDGESFPSHFGTGTEDYYGYAWAREERFDSAFHAQPCGEGNQHGGYCVNNRFRALDAIPFVESFRFDMELWHWKRTGINYAPTTFWYAQPGAVCSIEPDPEGAANPVARKREDVWKVYFVEGAVEGETLKIVETLGGVTEVQHGFPPKWSRERQIWWRDGKVGDKLIFEFNAERAGNYEVFAGLTRARDYGMVHLSVNGSPAKQTFDRYTPDLGVDELSLGRFDLKQGANRLEVEIAGTNEKAIQRYMFGLDYLRLQLE